MTKDGKLLHATRAGSIRELVDRANQLEIPREDVITVLPENGYYVLLYYYK